MLLRLSECMQDTVEENEVPVWTGAPWGATTGYNTLADVNDHALGFVWLSPIIAIAENQIFQVVILELCFSLSLIICLGMQLL